MLERPSGSPLSPLSASKQYLLLDYILFVHSPQYSHGRSLHTPLLELILLTWMVSPIYQAFWFYPS